MDQAALRNSIGMLRLTSILYNYCYTVVKESQVLKFYHVIRLNHLFPDVVSLLLEFLETAIHQILYTRHLYPTSIFVLKKKYNIPVWVSAHLYINLVPLTVLKHQF